LNNDAAEMNESVESDAFVIPSSSDRTLLGLAGPHPHSLAFRASGASRGPLALAGRPPLAITRSFSSMKRKRFTCSSPC
jgi:hypothetical protein